MRGGAAAAVGALLLLSLGAFCDTVQLENLFYEQRFGYPGDWIYTKPREFSVVFSGQEGTPAYRSTVAIENILSAKGGANTKTSKPL